ERYAYATVDLAPGNLLLIFTDGVIDANDEYGQEFGERRLLDCVDALPANLDAAEILVRLQQRIRTFVANAPKLDDVTWFVLRVAP
ncbi:MAG: SpoIIE family protein phosphatase, partial [bacterium]